ncbi:MAG: DUF349 domain-containing protein [Pseudomonadales bacterium]|nr:DUF349 domain-containing protein [Pseudomonadales bacterium]
MFRLWFKKDKLESDEEETRLEGVAELNPSLTDDASRLVSLAENDPSAAVRQAALALVEDPTTLERLLTNPDTADAAAAKLGQVVSIEKCAHLLQDSRILSAYLNRCDGTELEQVSTILVEPEQVAELAIRARGQVRDKIFGHQALQTENGLQTLERVARNRDKKCNRHARVLLDAVKNAKQGCAAVLARVNEVDESLKRAIAELKANPELPTGRARIDKMRLGREACLQDLNNHNQVLDSFGVATCQPPPSPLIGEVLPKVPTTPSADPRLVAFEQSFNEKSPEVLIASWQELKQAISAEFNDLEPALKDHYLRLDETLVQLSAAFTRLTEWQQLTPPEPLQLDNGSDVANLEKRYKSWLKVCKQTSVQLHWPRDVRPPASAAEIDREIDQANAALNAIKEKQSSALLELSASLKAVADAVAAGQYQQGVSAIKAARSELARHKLSPKDRQDHERELTTLSARLAELKDWQKYATLPKRQALLDELREIVDQPLEPPTQATRLRRMRDQWRELGIPSSADERNLQGEFDRLAEIAFAPCKVYYAEQDQIRAQNLASRQALCKQLASYLEVTDWPNTDFKAAEKIMRTAREEWRRFHPCERKALKPIEQQFEALQKRLHELIKQEWDRNVAIKQSIVSRADELLTLEDGRAMAEGAKNLQEEWKSVGSTPRAIDQRLWRTFRKACDDVFAQRQAAHAEAQGEAAQTLLQIEAAIQVFDALVTADGEPSRREFDEHNNGIEALLNQVRAPRSITDQLRDVRNRYQGKMRAVAQQKKVAEVQQLLDWDKEVSTAEAQQQTLEAPHVYFNNRSTDPISAQELLNLVLETEIVADIASPDSDQGARMALQIDLMNQGRRNTEKVDPRDLLKRWCNVAKPTDIEDLRERFAKAINELG